MRLGISRAQTCMSAINAAGGKHMTMNRRHLALAGAAALTLAHLTPSIAQAQGSDAAAVAAAVEALTKAAGLTPEACRADLGGVPRALVLRAA